MPHIIAIGRLRSGPELDLFARYAGRMRPRLGLTELAEARGDPAEVRRRESAALLAALPKRAFAVALDVGGQAPDSAGLAVLLERWTGFGRPVCFLIGGAEGLDETVLERADFVLSLGPLTWPHFLARAMLTEQLYRASTILAGHPYHRGRQP